MDGNTFALRYGPWALITGASSGLGAELAVQLSKAGLHVILVARREERLQKLAIRLQREFGVQTRILAVDLAEPDAYKFILEKTSDLEVGLLVNNAGYSKTGEFVMSRTESEQLMLRVNCEAPMQLAMEFSKKMVRRGRGGILFVSSSVAKVPTPYWTHYAATKSYILHFGEGLYHELKSKGVDVLTVCPGGMKTEFQTIAGIRDIGAMGVKPVASCAIRKLGHRPSVIPGWINVVAYQVLPKLLPARFRLALFGGLMKKLAR